MLLRRSATPLEKRLGYRFRRPELLEQALTHRSWAHEREAAEHYERLEFLGDAVLGLIAAEELFRGHPELPEGELSKRKSFLVSREVLARRGEELGLGELLRLGVGEERSGGREKVSLLADAVEAVLGAVYLDGGLDAARTTIAGMFSSGLARPGGGPTDAKTVLQETVQARGWPLPAYRLVEQAGPDHAKRFTVEVFLRGEPAGRGHGRSKKVAEQEAAAVALAALDAAAPVAEPGGSEL
jgi:ribonuclease III